jgi:hypothetical protein
VFWLLAAILVVAGGGVLMTRSTAEAARDRT